MNGPPPIVKTLQNEIDGLKSRVEQQGAVITVLEGKVDSEEKSTYTPWNPANAVVAEESAEETHTEHSSWWETHKHLFDKDGEEEGHGGWWKHHKGKMGAWGKDGGDWHEKMKGKWEFMSEMKEVFKEVDWTVVKEKMPWEMIAGKLEKMSDPDYKMVDWQAKKEEMKHNAFKTMLTSYSNLISGFFQEAAQRNVIDSLATVTKKLPKGTTCPNVAWGLRCMMEHELEESEFNPDALKAALKIIYRVLATFFLPKRAIFKQKLDF